MKGKIRYFYEMVKLNLRLIFFEFLAIAGFLYSSLSIVLSFISWDEMHIKSMAIKIVIIISILIVSIVLSFIHSIFFRKSKNVWRKGNNQVNILYGDVIKLGFKNKKQERVVVIPVNDYFDTIIDSANAKIKNPLIEGSSIHGLWLQNFKDKYSCDSDKIYELIKQNLDLRDYVGEECNKEKRKRGSLIKYPIGTIAEVDSPQNSTKYFLLAMSKFDDNNNAQSNKETIVEAVNMLIKYYDKYGQGAPMYIPLMGTKKSRADITHEQSLRLIKSCILNQNKIIGDFNIVVYNGDKDKVTIYKE